MRPNGSTATDSAIRNGSPSFSIPSQRPGRCSPAKSLMEGYAAVGMPGCWAGATAFEDCMVAAAVAEGVGGWDEDMIQYCRPVFPIYGGWLA